FGVERVEHGFDEQKIDISFELGLCLIEMGLVELIETYGAESRIVYIWRHRHRHGKGSHRSGNQSASSCLIGDLISRATGNSSRLHVHLMHKRAKIDIVHHALQEFLSLAACRRVSRKEKIVHSDRGGAERD